VRRDLESRLRKADRRCRSEVLGTSLHWQAFYEQQRYCLADLVALERPDSLPISIRCIWCAASTAWDSPPRTGA